jgi:hypothetical protein
VRGRNGRRARLLNAVFTGDLVDGIQKNETEWVRTLLEGGTLDPNSGTNDLSGTTCPPGTPLDDPRRYTGVQDYDDYPNDNPVYYDPERPLGEYAGFPRYPGVLDRAQAPFRAEGLKVPSYIAFGNHDILYLGTAQTVPTVPPHPPFERVAIGCVKPVYPVSNQDSALTALDPGFLQGLLTGGSGSVMAVPPDKNRQFVDRMQFKAIQAAGTQADDHGFAYVDPEELKASAGTANYYAFTPKRGVRYIVLDTTGQAGTLVSPSSGPNERPIPISDGSRGNIDDPQWKWLERELEAATRRDQLILVFAHHGTDRFDNTAPDELAECTGVQDEHGHDTNPSCDNDPRRSTPLHFGNDLIELLARHPHVVAYVAGHTHSTRILSHKRDARGFWEIKTPSTADWPPQHRVVDLIDNRDGTLSLFATVLDHAAPVPAPPSGTSATGFGVETLAAVGRLLTFNDPQFGLHGPSNTPDPDGERTDRNAELVIRDPRRNQNRCAALGGRLSGTRLHRARLGRTRGATRRSYPSRSTRRGFDYFCLADGRLVRAGYSSRRLRRGLSRREARRVRGRAVLVLTSSRRFGARGVRRGTRVATMRRRVRGERRFRVGRNTWYLVRGKRATIVYRTQRGRVRAVGIADRRLTRGRRAARRFLRTFNR